MINYALVSFGTFGSPNGFTQSFHSSKDWKHGTEIIQGIRTFDINTSALNLFPGSTVYSIRKDSVEKSKIIAYSIYTFAREQNSTRGGTFIGSGILFINKIAEENLTIKCLNEFHSNIRQRNLKKDVFLVNHSEKFMNVKPPADFDKIDFNLREIENLNFIRRSGKQLVVYCKTTPEALQDFFKRSIDLLNVYDTIYFTQSDDVATFVHNKGIFRLIQNVGDKIEFEQEIQKLEEKRRKKREASISEFDNEKRKIEEDRAKLKRDLQEQLARNEKLHQENSLKIKESKEDIEKADVIYTDFLDSLRRLTDELKSNRKPEEVRPVYDENKRRFIEALNQLKIPVFINTIPKVKTRTHLTIENTISKGHNEQTNVVRGRKIDKFKFISAFLFLLWIATLLYLIFASKKEETVKNIIAIEQPKVKKEEASSPVTTSSELKLMPIPNAELNENDVRIVARKLKQNISANKVVKIIFDENPTDIKSTYSGQEEIYEKLLIKRNGSCFEKKDGVDYFVKDTLRHIPSYKNENKK